MLSARRLGKENLPSTTFATREQRTIATSEEALWTLLTDSNNPLFPGQILYRPSTSLPEKTRPRPIPSPMADSQPPQGPAGSQGQNRGGRRRGRGGANQTGRVETQHRSNDGSSRGSRGRGRGGRGGGGRDKQANASRGAEASGKTTAEGESRSKQVPAATDDADDGEICFICASNVEHTSVSPCNHRTCHICALRLRALYKNKACAHCRVC